MSSSVSVIIPTYNYGRFIGEAIESAIAQTYPVNEIVVVDNASTDDTQEVVERYARDVHYILQDTSGVCAARNLGAASTRGEYLAFLDADDRWHPEKIEKQMAKFAENDEFGLVHCGMREFDDGTGETIRLYMNGGEGNIADNFLLWQPPAVIGPGGTIVVKRAVFDEVGGFDPGLAVGEDWDFCYRVASRYKIGFVAEALVDYRSHGSNSSRNVREMERGMGRMLEKAFDTTDPAILGLKRRAYGNYHRTLAGSYLQSGQVALFLTHTVKSLWNRPSNIGYFAQFPIRRLKRTDDR